MEICFGTLMVLLLLVFFCRYDEAPVEYKPYRQKDGALLAIGALCDKLKQTDPYKSELERMLVQHVFPEFSSPVGHLRAKVYCSVLFSLNIFFCCLVFYILAISIAMDSRTLIVIGFSRLQSINVSLLRVSLCFSFFLEWVLGCMGCRTICPH